MTVKFVSWSGGPAGDYICDGTADQTEINTALAWSNANPNNTICMRGGHTYLINDKISVGSHTIWNAEVGAIIKVANSAAGAFPDGTPVIGSISGVTPTGLEIYGFEIDGNCQNQSTTLGLAHGKPSSAGSGVERVIGLYGASGSGTKVIDINIHDMNFHDCFGEAFHSRYCQNVRFHHNTCINLQHDAVFLLSSNGTGNEIHDNTIQAITDGGIRCDSCQNIKIYNNAISPYRGSNNNGAYKYGANGIQIANNASYIQLTDNIDVYNNTFTDIDLCGIWLNDQKNTAGTTAQRVHIYNNTFNNCGATGNNLVDYGGAIAIEPWGNGIAIDNNIFNGSHPIAILINSAISGTSTFGLTIGSNNIINTQGKGTSGSTVTSAAVGYGIYNKVSTKITATITGNYFSGNLSGIVYPTSLTHSDAAASISTAGAGIITGGTTPIPPGGSEGGIINPGSGNSVIPTRYIPVSNSLQQDWIFDGYYAKDVYGRDRTAYVNGVPFSWQKKSVSSSQSLSQEHPAGINGDNIGDFGERGATLNLDCRADSLHEAFDIISTMKARTPTIIELGGVYKDYYLEGKYQDRNSEVDNTNIDEYPDISYPFSASFLLDRSCLYSKTKRVRSRKIYTDGQVWNSDDSYAGNLLRNASFESWTANIISSAWLAEVSAASNDWYGMAWSPDLTLFAAVASSGASRVMTSPNGITWTSRTPSVLNNWKAVCWGDGLFVAVSDSGTGNRVMTSANGIDWTIRTSAADANWAGVCYSAFLDLFCAVGATTAGAGSQVTADTGTVTAYTSPATLYTQGLSLQYTYSLAALAGGNQYRFDQVFGSQYAQNVADLVYMRVTLTSASYNGGVETQIAEWSTQSGTAVPQTQNLNILLNAADAPVLKYYLKTPNSTTGHRSCGKTFGYKYTPITTGVTNQIMTSPDGTTWTGRVASSSQGWSSVCWADPIAGIMPDGLLVVVSTTGRIMTSSNGIDWVGRTSPALQTWTSVCYSKQLQLFVAVSSDGTQQVMTSQDGITWTLRSTPNARAWTCIKYADEVGLFAAVAKSGTGNRIMTSPDGYNWTLQISPNDNDWAALDWSPVLNAFAAVSITGTVNRAMLSPNLAQTDENLTLDGWTIITAGGTRDSTEDDYAYLITGNGTAEFPGGISQVIKPESGIVYVLSATAYTENVTQGKLDIEIYADGAIIKQLTWDVSDTAQTQKQVYFYFDVVPDSAKLIIQGMDTPNNGALFHVKNIIFEKAADFEIGSTGNSIMTFGAYDSVPDIEVTSTYLASASTTVGQQIVGRTSDSEDHTSIDTVYSAADTSLALVIIRSPLSSGNRYRLDEVFSNLGPSVNGTAAWMKVTVQAASLYSGLETTIAEWSDSTHVNPTIGSYKKNLGLLAATTDTLTIRYYMKTANASSRAIATHLGYKYSIVSTVPVSGGVSIYNTADPLTVMRLCNALRPNCKAGINADYTGYYEYSDTFIDDSYLDTVASAPSGTTYTASAQTISLASGTLLYKFDTLYPVTGIPFMKIFVASGCPRLSISTNNIDWHLIDGNTTANITNAQIDRQLNSSADAFFLKGNTVFYIKIEPVVSPCVIKSIFMHADMNTMDCQRVKIRATEQPESFCALLDSPANVVITEKFRDTNPVI